MTLEAAIGLAIFVATYALIASDRIDKTLAAMAGGVLMILVGVVSQEAAFAEIDFNVIFLLAGMMIMAAILRRTGVFGWLAVRAARFAGADPYRVLVVMSLLTAGASMLLPNVTTVILVAPITLFLAARLGISPLPFVLSEIFAANIGGAATLIGDPPNTLIGSAAGLGFDAFLVHLAPLAVLLLALYLLAARWIFRDQLTVAPDLQGSLLALDERQMITEPGLLRVAVAILSVTLLGFLVAGPLGYQPATIALTGALGLMVVAREDPEAVLRDVEWPTLFFFIGLFMLVAGLLEIGVIDVIARMVREASGGTLAPGSLLILWFSAVASAIVDNVPYTATMIPVVEQLTSGRESDALWWALAIGADLGGNATVIGASANIVLASISGREGHPIGFGTFLRYGVPVTLGTMLVSTAYLWVRYLI